MSNVVFIEQKIIEAFKKLLTGKVNDILRRLEFQILDLPPTGTQS